jgi:hypothetical protein
MANRPRYQLVEIVDDGLPVYVAMQRIGEPYIDLAWQYRHCVDNPLMRFLRGLEGKPQARVILGNTSPLPWATVRKLMQYQRKRVADMSGSNGPPEFALWLPTNKGGREGRECVRIRGDVVQGFGSVESAARAALTTRDDIEDRLDAGCRDGLGWAWFDGRARAD